MPDDPTVDAMILHVEAKDDRVRIFTRCLEHGEFTYEIPMDHLAMIAQLATSLIIKLRGVEGMLDLLAASKGLHSVVERITPPKSGPKKEPPHTHLSDDAINEIMKRFDPSQSH